jgi:hypothetical protein
MIRLVISIRASSRTSASATAASRSRPDQQAVARDQDGPDLLGRPIAERSTSTMTNPVLRS